MDPRNGFNNCKIFQSPLVSNEASLPARVDNIMQTSSDATHVTAVTMNRPQESGLSLPSPVSPVEQNRLQDGEDLILNHVLTYGMEVPGPQQHQQSLSTTEELLNEPMGGTLMAFLKSSCCHQSTPKLGSAGSSPTGSFDSNDSCSQSSSIDDGTSFDFINYNTMDDSIMLHDVLSKSMGCQDGMESHSPLPVPTFGMVSDDIEVQVNSSPVIKMEPLDVKELEDQLMHVSDAFPPNLSDPDLPNFESAANVHIKTEVSLTDQCSKMPATTSSGFQAAIRPSVLSLQAHGQRHSQLSMMLSEPQISCVTPQKSPCQLVPQSQASPAGRKIPTPSSFLMQLTSPGSQPHSPASCSPASTLTLTKAHPPPPPYPGTSSATTPTATTAASTAGNQHLIPVPVTGISTVPVRVVSSPTGHTSAKHLRPIQPRPAQASNKPPRNTHPGCTTIRYNRKNNPELEKRRVHYCNFESKFLLLS